MQTNMNAQDIRNALKTRASRLDNGTPLHDRNMIWLTRLVRSYIERVGLATYLSQMLGSMATKPVSECELYGQEMQVIAPDCDDPDEGVQDFIEREMAGNLPFAIENGGTTIYL